ncbi:hypothetical protein R1flu_004286 [Riccia fluitans]|uniref:Uncharacterized protein n=1 Tax=Riccia fluitans TaxID=41844 RepID=A0ABD1YPV6_9MARC
MGCQPSQRTACFVTFMVLFWVLSSAQPIPSPASSPAWSPSVVVTGPRPATPPRTSHPSTSPAPVKPFDPAPGPTRPPALVKPFDPAPGPTRPPAPVNPSNPAPGPDPANDSGTTVPPGKQAPPPSAGVIISPFAWKGLVVASAFVAVFAF